MKSKEELNALKEEVETVSRKLHELTDEELVQVSGGTGSMNFPCPQCGGPGDICNGHYWCDNYKGCGYHNSVEKTPNGQVKY